MLDDYEHGVWLAELAAISDPAMVGSLIVRALSLQEAADRPMLDTLLSFLKRKHLLLVLDNCEHAIDEVRRVVAAILQTRPNVSILATSRESCSIAGEQAYRLPSLAVPSVILILKDSRRGDDLESSLTGQNQ
jgi:predicted ATPase